MLHSVSTVEIWWYLISNNCSRSSNSKRRRGRTYDNRGTMSFHDGAPTSIKLYTASVAHGTPGNSNVLLYLFTFDKLRREKLGQSQGVCTDYDWLGWSWHTASAWTRGFNCSVSQAPPRWLISLRPRWSLKRCSTTWGIWRCGHRGSFPWYPRVLCSCLYWWSCVTLSDQIVLPPEQSYKTLH